MSILEAVASDTVIAMSGACNLPEMFERGCAVETGMAPDLIEAALETCVDMTEDVAAAFKKDAKSFVAEHMSEGAVVKRFSEVYAGSPPSTPSDLLKSDEESSIFTGAASFSFRNRLVRAAWGITWALMAKWTPPPMHKWRILLLKIFGADVDWSCKVYGSAQVWLPANLHMGAQSVMGPRVICYNQGPISLGSRTVVSQGAHLCSGTHDINSSSFQLHTAPINIGAQAWICADAFVGPGVTVGEGAVLGARGAAFRSLLPWTVHGGNPAKCIKNRLNFTK